MFFGKLLCAFLDVSSDDDHHSLAFVPCLLVLVLVMMFDVLVTDCEQTVK